MCGNLHDFTALPNDYIQPNIQLPTSKHYHLNQPQLHYTIIAYYSLLVHIQWSLVMMEWGNGWDGGMMALIMQEGQKAILLASDLLKFKQKQAS